MVWRCYISVNHELAKPSLKKDRSVTVKGISPKMNIIAQLEFELAYYNVTVQHISHYIMGFPANHTLLDPLAFDANIAAAVTAYVFYIIGLRFHLFFKYVPFPGWLYYKTIFTRGI